MTDPDDDVTLPLLESACKQAFCEFAGQRSFEDDGGWSYEVWRTGWNSAIKTAIKMLQDIQE
jgi:hypothetical protein